MTDLFEEDSKIQDGSLKSLVLVIYDISAQRKRTLLSRLLKGYGFRIQRSAFACNLSSAQVHKLLKELMPFMEGCDDCIKVYRMPRDSEIASWGTAPQTAEDDVYIL